MSDTSDLFNRYIGLTTKLQGASTVVVLSRKTLSQQEMSRLKVGKQEKRNQRLQRRFNRETLWQKRNQEFLPLKTRDAEQKYDTLKDPVAEEFAREFAYCRGYPWR